MAVPIRLDKTALQRRAEQEGHFTHEEIAAHARIGRSALTKLLLGQSMPKVDTLIALRNAYGFPSLDCLLEGAEPPAVPAQAGAQE